jgi:hexosaminidase
VQAITAPAQAATAPEWQGRLAAHLRRLDAAGVGYRPLNGPHRWQEGGSGLRSHRAGNRIGDIAAHLDKIARQPDVP